MKPARSLSMLLTGAAKSIPTPVLPAVSATSILLKKAFSLCGNFSVKVDCASSCVLMVARHNSAVRIFFIFVMDCICAAKVKIKIEIICVIREIRIKLDAIICLIFRSLS